MFELTGRLDDMSTKVSVCVLTAAAPFFHWSLLTPIKVLHMTGLQQGLIAQRFVFILFPREVLKISASSPYTSLISHKSYYSL